MELVDAIYEPNSWFICFNRETKSRWGRLVPGRYRHARAFAFLPRLNAVIFYDMGVEATQIHIVPLGEESARMIASWLPPGSAMIEMPRLPPRVGRWPLGHWCAAGLAHLIGLRLGALPVPDRLWNACIANGGKPVAMGAMENQ